MRHYNAALLLVGCKHGAFVAALVFLRIVLVLCRDIGVAMVVVFCHTLHSREQIDYRASTAPNRWPLQSALFYFVLTIWRCAMRDVMWAGPLIQPYNPFCWTRSSTRCYQSHLLHHIHNYRKYQPFTSFLYLFFYFCLHWVLSSQTDSTSTLFCSKFLTDLWNEQTSLFSSNLMLFHISMK